jgi:multicomponent Na+:H+ antiporter subunit E
VIVRSLALLVVWIALWGELSVANVVSGFVTIGLLALVFPGTPGHGHRLHPVGAVRLLGSVLASLVVSTWRVVLAVVRPTPDRVHAEVIPVELGTRSPLVASIVANSITLTPGTMTVDLDPSTFELQVHVLGKVDHDEFRAEVRVLEQRVVAALGPGGAR